MEGPAGALRHRILMGRADGDRNSKSPPCLCKKTWRQGRGTILIIRAPFYSPYLSARYFVRSDSSWP
jgi:hypothetical protein